MSQFVASPSSVPFCSFSAHSRQTTQRKENRPTASLRRQLHLLRISQGSSTATMTTMLRSLLIVAVAFIGGGAAFQSIPSSRVPQTSAFVASKFSWTPALRVVKGKGDFDDIEDVNYDGNVDWDGEWKKVVSQQSEKVDRPGNDFYKNDAEKVVIKSVNKVAEGVVKARDSLPRVEAPNIKSLQGDWKASSSDCLLIAVHQNETLGSSQFMSYRKTLSGLLRYFFTLYIFASEFHLSLISYLYLQNDDAVLDWNPCCDQCWIVSSRWGRRINFLRQ